MARGTRFTVIIEPQMKRDLELVAIKEETTPSKFVRRAVEERLKKVLKR